ncbi:MAG: mreD [Bacillales bacterium]|jgi:rod shape-determining protein MreD|nr:mreD [Bacillales bacterium]
MIKKINLLFIGFICFAIENVFAKNIMTVVGNTDHIVVLRLVIVYLIFLAIYGERNFAIGVAFVLGLAFDIINLEIIGIYMAILPAIVYLATKFMRYLPEYMATVSTVCFFSIVLLEFIIFISFRLMGIVQMDLMTFVEKRLVYTMVLNFVTILISSYPFAKISSKWAFSEF